MERSFEQSCFNQNLDSTDNHRVALIERIWTKLHELNVGISKKKFSFRMESLKQHLMRDTEITNHMLEHILNYYTREDFCNLEANLINKLRSQLNNIRVNYRKNISEKREIDYLSPYKYSENIKSKRNYLSEILNKATSSELQSKFKNSPSF